MKNHLEPQPMTPAEVADLVERVKSAGRDPRARQLANLKRVPRGSGLGPVAARLARDQGVSLTIAAELVGIARPTVHGAWRALFGSEPTPRTASRRKARASEVRS